MRGEAISLDRYAKLLRKMEIRKRADLGYLIIWSGWHPDEGECVVFQHAMEGAFLAAERRRKGGVLIEFETRQGRTVWVGVAQIVSIVQVKGRNAAESYAEVKMSDGTVYEAVEEASTLGSRIIDATGMHLGASPKDPKPNR